MTNLTSHLVAKDLYIYRWLVAGATTAGLVSLGLSAMGGKAASTIGFLTWLTTIIALGIMLPMFGIQNERKDRSLLFLLSLPLSPRDYVRAKLFSLILCFLLCWLTLSAGAMTLVLAIPRIPDGMLPTTVLLCVFLLTNFSVVLSFSLHVHSESAMSAVIIVTNMSVSLYIFLVGAIPGIASHRSSAAAVWNTEFWTVLACLCGVMAVALIAPFIFAMRRRDFF